MPYRNSPHQKIEILMSFNYLNVFKPNEHKEDYRTRKPNDQNFLFEIEDKEYNYAGEKLITLETNDVLVKYLSEHGFNDVRFPFSYVEENNYFTLHQKVISIQEYESSTEKKRVREFT